LGQYIAGGPKPAAPFSQRADMSSMCPCCRNMTQMRGQHDGMNMPGMQGGQSMPAMDMPGMNMPGTQSDHAMPDVQDGEAKRSAQGDHNMSGMGQNMPHVQGGQSMPGMNMPGMSMPRMDTPKQRGNAEAAEQTEVQSVLTSRSEEIFRDPNSPVDGNPAGDVTLVEFVDYNCPYCRQVAPTMAEVKSADPKLRIVYKEFPLLGPNSTFAAKAALAAHRQGKYLPFHKGLMQSRGRADQARVFDVASKVGLDVERMKSDLNDAAIAAAIEKNLALAQALRINGTPSFVIGDQVVRGTADLNTLQSLIGEVRKGR